MDVTVIMVYNGVIMGIRDTLFAIITFVIMVYNGVIMENGFKFADAGFADACSCHESLESQASPTRRRTQAVTQA